MVTQRIPVSLSKNDYAHLNYVRQGHLYGNHSVSDLPEIGSILKACSFYGAYLILGDWEDHGRNILESFFSQAKDEKALKRIPSTENEFINELKKSRIKQVFKGASESIRDFKGIKPNFNEKNERNNFNSNIITDHSLSNYILTLKNDEIELLKAAKDTIENFSDNSFSFSEIIRFLFRYFFVCNADKNHIEKKMQIDLLSVFFIFGLYGFTPIESLLLRLGTAGLFGFDIPMEKINVFKKIYADQTLFNIYIESAKKNIEEKKGNGANLGALFGDIMQNIMFQDKYKSIISGFSFHSTFIGYSMLETEWYFNMHNIPLLSAYLYSLAGISGTYIIDALENYQNYFRFLFELSKKANENDDFLFGYKNTKLE